MWGLLARSYCLGRLLESLEGTPVPVQGEGPTRRLSGRGAPALPRPALPRPALPCPARRSYPERNWLLGVAAAGPLGHHQDALVGWRWGGSAWGRGCVSTCAHVCELCVSMCPSGLGMQRHGHGGTAGEILEG